MEIYKDIPGYEGFYQVSNLGNVKSIGNSFHRKDKIIRHHNKNGYRRVQLFSFGVQKKFYIYRLVMLAFAGPSKLEVNHKNHNPQDNRLENLEYVTRLENIKKRRPYQVICCPNCCHTFNYRKSPARN